MRTQFTQRLRSSSQALLRAIPPSPNSKDYSPDLANLATRIFYRSPLPSQQDLPVFVLSAEALPDTKDVDFDKLLPYVLARLPDEEELVGGHGYEIVFFAGGKGHGTTTARKGRPGWGWFLQAYHLLTRATRKRLQKLYIVHEKAWIRFLVGMFSTVVSPKFYKKVIHVSTLSQLALHIPIENLLIPPSVYLTDRQLTPDIFAPYSSGKRAFAVPHPLPTASGDAPRLPRVLREATGFLITDPLLRTEGVFRINARAIDLEILKEAYNRGQKFIVWRERDTYRASTHQREGFGDVSVNGIERAEGWGVHTAAGLIKQWYRDLQDPLVPQSSYAAVEKFYGNASSLLEPEQLRSMLSQETHWSILPKLSRHILTMHLLPLLSRTAEFSDWNQMTPQNLAVCFAPLMLRGPDPMEDLRISNIMRRLLEAMIVMWRTELAAAFHMAHMEFEDSLRMPEAVNEREDPLQEALETRTSEDTQTSGILLLDNDDISEETEDRPALPPRPRQDSGDTNSGEAASNLRRKPVTPVYMPPRYSTVFGSRYTGPGDGYTNNVPLEDEPEVQEGRSETREDGTVLPAYEDLSASARSPPPPSSMPPSIRRKPLSKTEHDS